VSTPQPTSGFRRRHAGARAALHAGPNMTPMVDVVMVILVFFMASAAFVGPEWFLTAQAVSRTPPPIPTTPTGGGSVPAPEPLLRILLRTPPAPESSTLALATFSLDGAKGQTSPVTADAAALNTALRALLAKAEPSTTSAVSSARRAVILAEPEVPYLAVVLTRELLGQAGLTSVGIAAATANDLADPLLSK